MYIYFLGSNHLKIVTLKFEIFIFQIEFDLILIKSRSQSTLSETSSLAKFLLKRIKLDPTISMNFIHGKHGVLHILATCHMWKWAHYASENFAWIKGIIFYESRLCRLYHTSFFICLWYSPPQAQLFHK